MPVVGMEPCCLAVFKDELPKLLPHDDDAEPPRPAVPATSPSSSSELDIDVPRFAGPRRCLGPLPPQGHRRHRRRASSCCERMGLDVETVDGGCCGLAGSWGFEAGHYDISIACGEEALLPAVRDAAPDTVVVADGFSCQTQIADGRTGRHALHVAQVIAIARRAGGTGHDRQSS